MHLRYFSETPTLYQNYLAMSNTSDGTGGKPIAVWSQSISGANAINPLVAFYNIHGRKREVIFFYIVPDTPRDYIIAYNMYQYYCIHAPDHEWSCLNLWFDWSWPVYLYHKEYSQFLEDGRRLIKISRSQGKLPKKF
jgi:hypothetical protein